jgi:DNA-binding transcriptional MerR regulator
MSGGEGTSTARLTLSEAAVLLSVSPSTLQEWEKRFGYPKPTRCGNQWLYTHEELVTLRDALAHGLSVTAAIRSATKQPTV